MSFGQRPDGCSSDATASLSTAATSLLGSTVDGIASSSARVSLSVSDELLWLDGAVPLVVTSLVVGVAGGLPFPPPPPLAAASPSRMSMAWLAQ